MHLLTCNHGADCSKQFVKRYESNTFLWQRNSGLGPVSRKSRKLFGPEKLFLKLQRAYSVKLVFSYVVKGIKSKIITKFCASRRLRFEDTKRIMSPEIRPKSSGTFEKRAPGACFSKVPKLFGRISGDIILFVSSKRRRLEARYFAVILTFIPFTTFQKTSFTE